MNPIPVSPAVFEQMVVEGSIDREGRWLPPHARAGKPKNQKRGRQKAQRRARKLNRS